MIIGAMKSGTTTLHHVLEQHPEIVAGVRKELNFFQPNHIGNGMVTAYEALFPKLDKYRHAYTLDSSPSYTKPGKWDCAPPAIARLPGPKRLIYVLRNPIERIESHIAHNVEQGRWTAGKWPRLHVVGVSSYARQLAKFEAVGLLEDILLIDFAELTADPVGVAYQVHDFLGIARVPPKSIEQRNARKVNGTLLQQDQIPELHRLLHRDVKTLITRYGFKPANSWEIAKPPRRTRRPVSRRTTRVSESASTKAVEGLRYSLGFLIGADTRGVAGHFRRVDFPIPFAVHPRTQVAVAKNVYQPLAILGEVVHPDLPDLDLQGIADHLSADRRFRQTEIDKLVGRFAVIQGGGWDDLSIQTDAIGMRSVFFSVSDDGVIAGSHAHLVAAVAVPGVGKEPVPSRLGYPGISTPFASVFRLPPNCELSLKDGSVRRFFPDAPIPEVEIEAAWDFSFNRAAATVNALAKRRKLLLSLTAGLDSRTTLAASRDRWPELLFFTYNRGTRKHRIDSNVAGDLAKVLGLRHIVIDYPQCERDRRMLGVLAENTFTNHQHDVACAYHRLFGEGEYLHIRSNLLELARSNLFYRFEERRGFEAPCTAESMGAVYKRAAHLTPEASGHVVPAFEQYIAISDYESTIGHASPWDLYFVEHRMGAWHSGVVLESDLSFDTVIVFNSREVVRQIMGVPQETRCSNSHLLERLKTSMPEVADIPINPQQYSKRAIA